MQIGYIKVDGNDLNSSLLPLALEWCPHVLKEKLAMSFLSVKRIERETLLPSDANCQDKQRHQFLFW